MKRKNNWFKIKIILGLCGMLLVGMTACETGSQEPVKTYPPVDVIETADSVEESTREVSIIEESFTETLTTEVVGTEDITTEISTTEVPETEAPTMEVFTTEVSSAEVSETEVLTTEVPTTEVPTTVALVVQAVDVTVKGNYYIGDTLSAADFSVTVTMSDGSVRKNPVGWSADKLYLDHTENQITVTYQSVSTTIWVSASERPVETQLPTTEAVDSEETTETLAQQPTQNQGSAGNNEMTLRRDAAEEAFRIQNDLIVQNGGSPLQWSETFYQQACERAQEIVTNFSHDGFYDTTAYAENIAMGSYDANVMVQAWYNSDGHRSNMLHGWAYGAIACYGNHWVALFGPTPG